MQTRDISGMTIVVTGAGSGIGFFVAERLAAAGASIVVAARSAPRARLAIDALPGPGRHRHLPLDLADRASIEAAGDALGREDGIDGVILNAGIIAAPPWRETGAFGAELSVDVNVLAHAELVRRALPALRRADAARIVWIGSALTRRIPFDPDDWLSTRAYRPRVAYAMSKHATEMLGFELDRRLRAGGSPVRSVVVHPGSAIGALTPDRPGGRRRPAIVRALAPAARRLVAPVVQGKDAASDSAVVAMMIAEPGEGDYLGPANGLTGPAVLSAPASSSRDRDLGATVRGEVEALVGRPILG